MNKNLIKKFILVGFALLLLVGCPIIKEGTEIEDDNRIKVDYLWLYYCDGDNNLYTASLKNLFNIEKSLMYRDSKYSLEFITLFDGDKKTNDTILYPETKLLKMGATTIDESNDVDRKTFSQNTKDITSTVDWIPKYGNVYEADMSDYHTLQNFLSWAKSTYNAKKVIVTIYDHGAGPHSFNSQDSEVQSRSFCVDDTNGGNSMGTNELAIAFRDAKFHADILEFFCCLAGNFDETYEMRKYADYIVASPNLKIMDCPRYTIIKFLDGETTEETALAHANMIAVDTVESYKDIYNQEGTCPLTDQWYDNSPDNVKGDKIDFAEYTSCPFYANTVSVYNTSACENVYQKFNKIIDYFYNEIQTTIKYNSTDDIVVPKTPKRPEIDYSSDMARLKMFDDKTLMIHYLYATDMSFLVNRGIRGRNKNYKYLTNKWTSISYEGTYNSLYDLGYLMDMYMYTYKEEQEANVTDGITTEFNQMCVDLSNALKELIMFSWRRLATAAEFDDNEYENVTIAGKTFKRTKGIYPKYLSNLGMSMSDNNLGITIPCCSPAADSKYVMPAFKKDPFNDDIYVPYIGLAPDGSYYYASTFSKTTKWYEVINWLYPADKRYLDGENNTDAEFDSLEESF